VEEKEMFLSKREWSRVKR